MKIANADFELVDGKRVFLWQYCNALQLNQILLNEIEFYGTNVKEFVSNWQTDVFDLNTANSFGLDVWGKILGAPRPQITPQNYVIDTSTTLRLYNPNTNQYHAIWIGEGLPHLSIETNPPASSFYSPILLGDEAYRRCLRAKLFLLNSNASVVNINKFLNYLFPNKICYVQDNFDMTMSIVFGFIPTDIDLTVITYDAFSPRPMGVYMNYGVKILDTNVFAFKETQLGTWGDNTNTLDPTQIAQGLGTFYTL